MTADDAIAALEPHVRNMSARLAELEQSGTIVPPDKLREIERGIELIHGLTSTLFPSLGAIDDQLADIVERLRRLQGS